jgi:RHS repeat-associated protein
MRLKKTVTNTYVNRLRTGLGLLQPSCIWTNGFLYDAAKRLTNVTSSAGSFGYIRGGPAPDSLATKKLLLPSGAYITNTFDGNARLLGTYLKNSGNTVLDSYAYSYDAANQRTNLLRADAITVAYTYDPIGQLTLANSSFNSDDRAYIYDAAWNLNRRTNGGFSTVTYTPDQKNELTNVSGTVGALNYDANGNPTNQNSAHQSYEYDDENRLVAAQVYYLDATGTPQGWRTVYVYDGLGRLREREEFLPNPGAGISPWSFDHGVIYIYDGFRVIQERNEGSVPQVSYTRGTDLSGSLEGAGGIGGLLARSSGYSGGAFSTHNYYFADGNGNITYMLNSSQSMVAKYKYDPYGNQITQSGSLWDQNLYRFSSKEFQTNTSAYYYGYRFYAPGLQRWLNRDPIEELGGINQYRFVESKPVNETDSYGLTSIAVTVGEAIATGDVAQMADLVALGSDIGLTAAQQAALRAAIASAAAGAAVASGDRCESRGRGERKITGKAENPWKGWQPNDPAHPEKGGTRRDPQTGKKIPAPMPTVPKPK